MAVKRAIAGLKKSVGDVGFAAFAGSLYMLYILDVNKDVLKKVMLGENAKLFKPMGVDEFIKSFKSMNTLCDFFTDCSLEGSNTLKELESWDLKIYHQKGRG